MQKNHFKKVHYEDEGWCYVRTRTQKSKNHKDDSQDLRKGGLIPFEENEFGLSSGLFLEKYQSLLSPDHKNMFQLPKYGKAFKKTIHKKKKGNEVLFVNQKVGHTYVGQFMPKVNITIYVLFFMKSQLRN